MSDPFFNVNLLRVILEGETDADSPGSEELLSQVRENWEVLLMLFGYTGDSGTATENPTETILTDDGAAYAVDEHNGRSLVIIDGTAAGNIYTIDDTTATTLTCTGDTLLSDGVLSGDAYKVFYNLKNTSGHTHDGVDSPSIFIKTGTYTGDGGSAAGVGDAQAITGVGFQPKYVRIWVHATAEQGEECIETMDNFTSGYAYKHDDTAAAHFMILEAINSLDADGFTVDDNGANANPNANTIVYDYVAIG